MYQFFVEPNQIQEKNVIIMGPDVNHIKNVLRMKIGEELAVSNGEDGKEYRCQIEELGEESIICRLLFIKEDGLELASRVYLFQALPKGDKMELIIQKAVELGVHEIIPVSSKRAIVKLDEKKAKTKVIRWQGIAEAAAKQSKRRIVPKVNQPFTFSQAIAYASDMDIKLIPYELSKGMKYTKELMESIGENQQVAIFIGPEGGFDEEEIQMAEANGICPITLGKRILRTETAGMTVLSWIMYQLERD